MASGSRQSGLETRSETTLFDPVLTSWMSREPPPPGELGGFEEEEEAKKKEVVDPEGELRELFRIFDKHHDNTIGSSELGKMLRCMGMEVTDVEVSNIMRALDRNGNGKIEFREFKSFIQDEMRRLEESPREQKKAVRLAFRVFDYNEDGFIDANELRTALQNLGEPLSEKELNDLMKDADVTEDGKVNYEAFIRIWLETSKESA
ncbi:hypothetical protein BsWGS_14085 [Bradybaena similaris]